MQKFTRVKTVYTPVQSSRQQRRRANFGHKRTELLGTRPFNAGRSCWEPPTTRGLNHSMLENDTAPINCTRFLSDYRGDLV